MKAKKVVLWIVIILVLAFIAIQFVPVERTNPPVTAPLQADADVMQVLRDSCYDCHSNETEWPWWAFVAPSSWLVAADVNEAREHMNFSEWGNLPADERAHLGEEIIEEVEDGAMPLPQYLIMHPDAEPLEQDIEVLDRWTAAFRAEGSEHDHGENGEEEEQGHEDESHEDEESHEEGGEDSGGEEDHGDHDH